MNDLRLLACPRSHAQLVQQEDRVACSSARYTLAAEAFAKLCDKPVLIEVERSIVERRAVFVSGGGNHIECNVVSRWRTYRLVKRFAGGNRGAARNAELFRALLNIRRPRPMVVIAGGATRGFGSDRLWTDPQIELISFDIYDSPNVRFLADAHDMLLLDGSLDGVWAQVVLEHVLEPDQVVSEIDRVLAPERLVYAESPFMQRHDFQHDFFRVSHSAHRWLFRGFDELKSGPVAGAGTVLELVDQVPGMDPDRVADGIPRHLLLLRLAAAPPCVGSDRRRLDSACGLYFLRRRSETALVPPDMVAYYDRR